MRESKQTQGKLVLIIGPSGVGKSVILKQLRGRHPELVVPHSATTRVRRPNEGTDLYRFVSEEEFDELMKKDAFLEWAHVHAGPRYGTLLEEIVPPINEGKIVLREVDVQGFASISSHPLFNGPDARYTLQSVFILPENPEQLIERITKRAPISQEELQNRMRSMEQELGYADKCTVKIINRDGKIDETMSEVEKAIFGSSKF